MSKRVRRLLRGSVGPSDSRGRSHDLLIKPAGTEPQSKTYSLFYYGPSIQQIATPSGSRASSPDVRGTETKRILGDSVPAGLTERIKRTPSGITWTDGPS